MVRKLFTGYWLFIALSGCVTAPSKTLDFTQLAKVKKGMRGEDVIAIMGEPSSRSPGGGGLETWLWREQISLTRENRATIVMQHGRVVSMPTHVAGAGAARDAFEASKAVEQEREIESKRATEKAEQDRREAERHAKRVDYLRRNSWLPEDVQQDVMRGVVRIGSPMEQVKLAYGEPDRVNRTVNAHAVTEQWVYGRTYFYFHNGVLSSWQESR